jgi:catechol 2,3-dioxygenase-like lactoylglutathione lyase family enzyme
VNSLSCPDFATQTVMSRYVDSTEQLVTEIAVRDIQRSACFYRLLGFVLLRDGGELAWENHRLFLAQPSAFHEVDRLESSVVHNFLVPTSE